MRFSLLPGSTRENRQEQPPEKKKALLLLSITHVLTTCAVVRISKSPLFFFVVGYAILCIEARFAHFKNL